MHSLSPKQNAHGRPFSERACKEARGPSEGFPKASMLQQQDIVFKKNMSLTFQVKVKLYTKTKSKNITLPAYNIPLHREAWDVKQAQASRVNSVCKLRF